ncbi:MAG: endonuclease/exonuclease/phosphatase family protein [Actinobacteria bacterium]|nr:endonuclease/exonuclease/phosphatase family protein [Actinomycetota bacterium]
MKEENFIKNSITLNFPWLYFSLIAINTLFGLQLINSFFSLLVNFFRERPSIDLTDVAIYALVTFLLVFPAGFLFRLLNKRMLFFILIFSISALRLCIQLCRWSPLSLAASGLGVLLWIVSIVFFIILLQERKIKLFYTFFPAFLFGFALNTAINGFLGTWDIVWRFEYTVFFLLIILIAIQTIIAILVSKNLERNNSYTDGSSAVFYSITAFMPFVFLQLYQFQNIAALNSITGLDTARSLSIIIFSNAAAIAFIYLIRVKLLRYIITVISAAVFVLAFWPPAPGNLYIIQVISGNLCGWWLLLTVFNRAASKAIVKTPWKNISASAISGILIFIFAFIYYGTYDLVLPLKGWMIQMIAAAMISFFSLLSVFLGFSLKNLLIEIMQNRTNKFKNEKKPLLKENILRYSTILIMLMLFILPALLLLPASIGRTYFQKKDFIRLVHYNIHQGFNIDGYQDLESIARVIEKEKADIVCLNEVSRGWVINGSADVYLWLADRLEMNYHLFMPASDLIWGNAILSKYPINLIKSGFLPRLDAPLRRSFIYANVNTGDAQIENINVLSTHLHHIAGDSVKRQAQVKALLEQWEGFGRTAICGDFNATTGDKEIEMLHDAGLIDSAVSLGKQNELTWVHYEPYGRIDYIWVTPDIEISDYNVAYSTASDHLPVALSLK